VHLSNGGNEISASINGNTIADVMLETSQMERDDLPRVNRDHRRPAIASESGAVISEQFERAIIVRYTGADHSGEGYRRI